MVYKCTECDYEGQKRLCPMCNYECIEFKEMTVEDDNRLEIFLSNKQVFLAPNSSNENYVYEKEEAIKILSENNSLHCYTIVTEENDEAYILDGFWRINSIGYFITTIKLDVPSYGIRYW